MKNTMTDEAPVPLISSTVHYVGAGHSLGLYNSTCRAAICTDKKDNSTLSLAVFTPHGTLFYEDITYDEGKAGGTWHWPEPDDVPTSSVLPNSMIAPTSKAKKS